MITNADKIITTAHGTPITVRDIAHEAREKLAALGGPTDAPAASDEALAADGGGEVFGNATDGEVFHGEADYDRTTESGTAADSTLDPDADDDETLFSE